MAVHRSGAQANDKIVIVRGALMLCLLDRQRIFEDVSAILNLARRDRIG